MMRSEERPALGLRKPLTQRHLTQRLFQNVNAVVLKSHPNQNEWVCRWRAGGNIGGRRLPRSGEEREEQCSGASQSCDPMASHTERCAACLEICHGLVICMLHSFPRIPCHTCVKPCSLVGAFLLRCQPGYCCLDVAPQRQGCAA